MEAAKLPCSVSRRGMGSDVVLRIKCNKWVNKRCSGIRKFLKKAVDYVCRKYFDFFIGTENDEGVTQDKNNIKKKQISRTVYLETMEKCMKLQLQE